MMKLHKGLLVYIIASDIGPRSMDPDWGHGTWIVHCIRSAKLAWDI
jgi:hypothetical protein